jgi:enoyl-CoA hydratase/carnithine racemase
MATTLVRYAVRDDVASLTLDSPHNRNALSQGLVAELLDGLDRAGSDDAAKVVLLAAEGRVFCSGADLAEAAAGSMADGAHRLVELQRKVVALPKPVVVRVQGAVRAGGIGLVAAADIAVATAEASFALTEVRLALAPAAISLTVLARLSSRAAARAFLTGETLDGSEAARVGLVTVAVPSGDLDSAVADVLADLRRGHPQGLREAKRLLNADLLARIDRDGPAMADLSGRLFGSSAAREAMQTFLSRGR